jgi:hypothetical protein
VHRRRGDVIDKDAHWRESNYIRKPPPSAVRTNAEQRLDRIKPSRASPFAARATPAVAAAAVVADATRGKIPPNMALARSSRLTGQGTRAQKKLIYSGASMTNAPADMQRLFKSLAGIESQRVVNKVTGEVTWKTPVELFFGAQPPSAAPLSSPPDWVPCWGGSPVLYEMSRKKARISKPTAAATSQIDAATVAAATSQIDAATAAAASSHAATDAVATALAAVLAADAAAIDAANVAAPCIAAAEAAAGAASAAAQAASVYSPCQGE